MMRYGLADSMGRPTTFSSLSLSVILCCGLCGQARSLPDVTVSWSLPERAPYAGETVPVILEITLPAAWEDGTLLQLYPRPLDLPLELNGFEALGALGPKRLVAVPALEHAPDRDGRSVVVDGEVSRANGPLLTQGPTGPVAVYTIRRWFRAPRAGLIDLPAPTAHYAVATEFRDDFVRGRVPVDRRTEDAIGRDVELRVLNLPEEGRPLEFAGAIGRFELVASTPNATATPGDTVRLAVSIHSVGRSPEPEWNARHIALSESDAFVEQGRTLSRPTAHEPQCVVISLLARAPSVNALPKASLAYFDPAGNPPGYQVTAAESPPLQVTSTAAPSTGSPEAADTGDGTREPRPIPYWTISVLALIFAFAVASVIRRQLAMSEARTGADAASRDA